MSGNTIAEIPTPIEVPDEPSYKRQNVFPEIEFAGPKPLGMARVVSEKPVSTKQNHIEVQTPKTKDAAKAQGAEIAALIAQARQKALEEERAREEAATAAVEAEQAKKRKREEREKEKSRKKEKLRDRDAYEAEKQANKEKRLQKLIGAVVVKTMQKYRGKDFSHDLFKKYAKEVRYCLVTLSLRSLIILVFYRSRLLYVRRRRNRLRIPRTDLNLYRKRRSRRLRNLRRDTCRSSSAK
jgi:hypothetical protein